MGDLPLLLMISHDIYTIDVHRKGLSIKAGMSARLYENWSCCAHARHCQFERVEADEEAETVNKSFRDTAQGASIPNYCYEADVGTFRVSLVKFRLCHVRLRNDRQFEGVIFTEPSCQLLVQAYMERAAALPPPSQHVRYGHHLLECEGSLSWLVGGYH